MYSMISVACAALALEHNATSSVPIADGPTPQLSCRNRAIELV